MKRALSFLLALAMIFTMISVGIISVSAVQSGDFTYNLYGNNATITGYTGSSWYVTIPDTIDGHPVTDIGLFDTNNNVSSITIGSSITSICDIAFEDCLGLTQIIVSPNNNSYSSQDGVLFNKTKSVLVRYPSGKTGSYIIPNSVTTINNYAFAYDAGLTDITISANVIEIGTDAFLRCNGLVSVSIPNNVLYIYNNAFCQCSNLVSISIGSGAILISSIGLGCTKLTQINVDSNNSSYSSEDGILFNKAKTYLFEYPEGKTNTSYVVPNSVNTIVGYAFFDCKGLTDVDFPDGLINIWGYSFYGCTNLNDIIIPDSTTNIGLFAFKNCTELTSVTIGSGLSNIGNSSFVNAFDGCINLEEFIVDEDNDTFSSQNGLFLNKSGTEIIICPMGISGNLEIPDSVINIRSNIFNCIGLTSVTLGSGVESFDNESFHELTNLSQFIVNNNNETFSSQNGLLLNKSGTTVIRCPEGIDDETLSIPNDVENIGEYAFKDCYKLTKVTIPNSVTTILNRAFSSCGSLKEITFGSGITNINANAFEYCDNIETFCFLGNAPLTGPSYYRGALFYRSGCSGFNNYYNTVAYSISGNTAHIIECTLVNSNNLVIPENIGEYPVTSIDDYAFYGAGISSVSIPSCVVSIGTGAFMWSSLSAITIANGVTTIGNKAFYGCMYSDTISIPSSVTSIGSDAFIFCNNIYVDTNNSTYSSQDGVLFNKTKTLLIHYPFMCYGNYTIPNSVTNISSKAFFCINSLANVSIPSSVVTIGSDNFKYCSELTQFTVDNNNANYSSEDGVLFNKSKSELIQYPASKSGSYTIPNTVTSIDSNSFLWCWALSGITIPSSVTTIGDFAFAESGPDSFNIPSSVTAIGKGALNSTAQIVVDDNNPMYSSQDGVLYNKSKTSLVAYPIGKSGSSFAVPNTVTTICDDAFYESNLSSISMPNSLVSIGENAFSTCYYLNNITIPSSVSSIGDGAFYYCSNLTQINVDTNNADYSSNGGFLFNKTKTTLVSCPTGKYGTYGIPSTVTEIQDSAFAGSMLTSITIPSSVTEIGNDVFYNCQALTRVYFLGNAPTIGTVNPLYPSYFVVNYISSSTGFSERWNGYPTATFDLLSSPTLTPSTTDPTNGSISITVTFPETASTKEYKIGSGDWTEYTSSFNVTDNDTIYARYFDENGKPSYTGSVNVSNIDRIPPATPTLSPSTTAPIDGNVTVTITYPGDADVCEYKIGNGSWTTYTDPVVLSENYTVYARCKDAADNDSEVGSLVVSNIIHPANFTYTVTNSQAQITGYTGTMSNLTLPSTLGGYPVTSIGQSAFKNKTFLTSVIIPSGVTKISGTAMVGYGSFSGCTNLVSVALPSSVARIDVFAFANCTSLTSINLNNVTVINQYAFSSCSSLTGILTLPACLTTIGSNAFSGCTGLTGFVVNSNNPNYSSQDGVLFNKTKTTLIQCPAGKTGNFTIPSTVTNISGNAFLGCTGLTGTIAIPTGAVIGSFAFQNCTGLTGVSIGATSIGSNAFSGCTGLIGTITIPSGATIGTYAFSGCTGLSGVSMSGATSIGSCAFGGCTGLSGALTIPAGATIGTYAFSGCTGLSGVSMTSVTSIGEGAFSGCTGLSGTLTIPYGITSIGNRTFNNCSGLKSINIPDTVLSIGDYAFFNCSKLINIKIPSSVTSIGGDAFAICSALKSAYFQGNAPSMGLYVFSGSGLLKVYYISGRTGFTNPWNGYPTEVIYPNDFTYSVSNNQAQITGYTGSGGSVVLPIELGGYPVTGIGSNAFYNCSSITDITIPYGVTGIGDYAFDTCTGLTSVYIPESVNSIGNYAFNDCSNLTGAFFEGDAPSMGNYVFEDCAYGFTVYYHSTNTGFTTPSWYGYPTFTF